MLSPTINHFTSSKAITPLGCNSVIDCNGIKVKGTRNSIQVVKTTIALASNFPEKCDGSNRENRLSVDTISIKI